MGRIFAVFILACAAMPRISLATIVAMPDRDAQEGTTSAYSVPASSFATVPLYGAVTLPAPDSAEHVRAKLGERGNFVGFGRSPGPGDGAQLFTVWEGQSQARILVTSRTARALRVAVKFGDNAMYSVLARAPEDPSATRFDSPSRQTPNDAVWGPITRGDTQELLITRAASDATPWSFTVAGISHITEDLFNTYPKTDLKALGDSASCQVDIACIFPLLPTAQQDGLLQSSRAVTLLIMTFKDGSSGTCTGTLLNTANYPTPLILTANHCVQDGLAGLTTLWLFSRAGCETGPVANYLQIVTSGSVVWQSAALDGALLKIDQVPPSPVSYSGWNANQLGVGEPVLAIHHPAGDVKKATLGTMLGFNTAPLPVIGLGTFSPGTFYLVDWMFGIVEHGSSGSGLFADAGDGLTLRLRGTLTTGSISCASSPRRGYYAQLYEMYPSLGTHLTTANTSPPPSGGSGIPAVEYYHGALNHYFITSVPDEITVLDTGTIAGWARTGQSFQVYSAAASGNAGVCRFFSTAFAPKSSHFYTPFSKECSALKQNADWQYEGVVYAVKVPDPAGNCPSGTQPLFRLYNNGQGGAPNHRYTVSQTIRSSMIAQGWVPEGYGPLSVISCVPV